MFEKYQAQQIKHKEVPTPSQKVQSSLNFLEHRKKQILNHHLTGITLKKIQQKVNSRSNSKSIKKSINDLKSISHANQSKKQNQQNQNYKGQQNNLKRSFLKHSRKSSYSSKNSRQSSKKNIKVSRNDSLSKLQYLLTKQYRNNHKQAYSNILRKGSQKQLNFSRASSTKSFKSISESSSIKQSRAILLNSISQKLIESKHNSIITEPVIINNNQKYRFNSSQKYQQKTQFNTYNSYSSKDIFDRLQKLQHLILQMGKFQPQNQKENLDFSQSQNPNKYRTLNQQSKTSNEYKQNAKETQRNKLNKPDQTFNVMLKQITKLKQEVKQIKQQKQSLNLNSNRKLVKSPIKTSKNMEYLEAYSHKNSNPNNYRDVNKVVNNNCLAPYSKFNENLYNNQNDTTSYQGQASNSIFKQHLFNVHSNSNHLEPSSINYLNNNNITSRFTPNIFYNQRNPYHYIGSQKFQKQQRQQRNNNNHKINLSQKPKINITFGVNNFNKSYQEADGKKIPYNQQQIQSRHLIQTLNNKKQVNLNVSTENLSRNSTNYINSYQNNWYQNAQNKQKDYEQISRKLSQQNLNLSQNESKNIGKLSLSKRILY